MGLSVVLYVNYVQVCVYCACGQGQGHNLTLNFVFHFIYVYHKQTVKSHISDLTHCTES